MVVREETVVLLEVVLKTNFETTTAREISSSLRYETRNIIDMPEPKMLVAMATSVAMEVTDEPLLVEVLMFATFCNKVVERMSN